MKIELVVANALAGSGYKRRKRLVYKQVDSVVVSIAIYKSRYSEVEHVDINVQLLAAEEKFTPPGRYNAMSRLKRLLPGVERFCKSELSESEAGDFVARLQHFVPTLETLFTIDRLKGLEFEDEWIIAVGFKENLNRLAQKKRAQGSQQNQD